MHRLCLAALPLKLLLLLLVGTLLPSETDAQPNWPPGWTSYGNARFQFYVCYPPKLLKPRGESENGDGQTFRLPQKRGTVLAYGGYNIDPESTKAYTAQQSLAEALDLAQQEGFNVTYTLLKQDFFVLTGTKGNTICYQKSIVADDRMITIQFTYVAAMKASLDPVIAQMARCLTVGPPLD